MSGSRSISGVNKRSNLVKGIAFGEAHLEPRSRTPRKKRATGERRASKAIHFCDNELLNLQAARYARRRRRELAAPMRSRPAPIRAKVPGSGMVENVTVPETELPVEPCAS